MIVHEASLTLTLSQRERGRVRGREWIISPPAIVTSNLWLVREFDEQARPNMRRVFTVYCHPIRTGVGVSAMSARGSTPHSRRDRQAFIFHARNSTLLAAFATQAVSVIGDLILDEYITGQAARVSREAPVIVVEEERREWLVGGAAMPALNVACLGGNARQLSVVGPDDAGRQLVGLLRAGGVDVGGVVVDRGRRTTTKTRIVTQGFLTFPQQVARVDRLDRHPLSADSERQLIDLLATMMPTTSAVLVSDYRMAC